MSTTTAVAMTAKAAAKVAAAAKAAAAATTTATASAAAATGARGSRARCARTRRRSSARSACARARNLRGPGAKAANWPRQLAVFAAQLELAAALSRPASDPLRQGARRAPRRARRPCDPPPRAAPPRARARRPPPPPSDDDDAAARADDAATRAADAAARALPPAIALHSYSGTAEQSRRAARARARPRAACCFRFLDHGQCRDGRRARHQGARDATPRSARRARDRVLLESDAASARALPRASARARARRKARAAGPRRTCRARHERRRALPPRGRGPGGPPTPTRRVCFKCAVVRSPAPMPPRQRRMSGTEHRICRNVCLSREFQRRCALGFAP